MGIIKTCECGKVFETSYSRQKYCSASCRINHLKKTNSPYKKCVACGKLFERTKTAQKYCSKECRISYNTQYYVPVSLRHFVCKWCGREFESKRKRYYCSKQCAESKWDNAPLPVQEEKYAGKSLSEVARLATKAGLTYGQYVLKYGGKIDEM